MHQHNRKRRWVRFAALLLLLLLGYASYRAIRPDPNLKKLKLLREEFASAGKDWTPEQRQAKGREMRQAMQALSPSQRESLAADGQRAFEKSLQSYAQLSNAEKVKYLDQQIDRSEKMRKEMAAKGPPGGGPGAFAGGPATRPPGGNQSPEDREKRRKERLDHSTPEFRALMDRFRQDMEQRRRQRGLPAGGFGPRA